ncbi:hypothetical protein DPV78_001015 [Talaromyces pinophilus]|nr:hypothetical protein DPV78_001015 [Talaromyces pinophilus]
MAILPAHSFLVILRSRVRPTRSPIRHILQCLRYLRHGSITTRYINIIKTHARTTSFYCYPQSNLVIARLQPLAVLSPQSNSPLEALLSQLLGSATPATS